MKELKISICTLGCRVNQYESDAIAEMLEKKGFRIVPFGSPCDASIINTCTVTAESDRKSRQLVRRALKSCPSSRVIVTGCSSQVSPEEIRSIHGVACVIGNGEKETIPAIIENMFDEAEFTDYSVGDIFNAKYDSFEISHARRTKAFIKIEDGCENRCAYCIIPKARGRVRSKKHEDIIKEITQVAKGCPEIILTGIETASYGKDRGERDALASLLSEVSKIEGVKRLTLGSLDPNALTDAFLQKIKDIPSLLPHFHLSIQSGCTSVLNRMRRKYNAEKALERIEAARAAINDVSFSADVIVGFPGETEEEFERTVEFCKKARFMHLHVFPYSVREGTEAASMDSQVPESVKKERCRRLAEIQKKVKNDLLSDYVARFSKGGCSVLFEQKKNGYNIGRSGQYIEIKLKNSRDLSNKTVDVSLLSHDGECCFGQVSADFDESEL